MRQRELAERAGYTESFVSLILNGIRKPSWSAAKVLAKMSGTDPILWLEGTTEEKKAALRSAENKGGDK